MKNEFRSIRWSYLFNPSEKEIREWKRIIKEVTESCRITYFPKEDGSGEYPYVITPSESRWPYKYMQAVKQGLRYMLAEELREADAVLLIEAKGYPLTCVVDGLPLDIIFARKRDYKIQDQIKIHQRKAYKTNGNNELFIVCSDYRDNGLRGDEKLLILETIISSGETVCSTIKELRNSTDCEILGVGAIYERGDGIEHIKEEVNVDAKGFARLEVIEENGIVKPHIPYFWDERERYLKELKKK